MKRVIAFYIQTPLTQRDRERFGAKVLQSRGFRVVFLDISNILNPEYVKRYAPPDPDAVEDVVALGSWNALAGYFKNNDVFLAVDPIGASSTNIEMYRIMKRRGIRYASLRNNSIPMPVPSYRNPDIGPAEKTKRILKRLMDPRIVRDVMEIIKKAMSDFQASGIPAPDYILEGGRVWSTALPAPGEKTKTISAHTFDYDLYLKFRMAEPQRVSKNDSIVFLDGYDPFAPDFLLSGYVGFKLDPEKYYAGIRKFFSLIESATGLPVKIAAHPRSRYDLHPDYFGGRQAVLGKTNELVFDSRAVLTHASTAVNFAVLYKKPVIFITSDQLNRTNYALLIDNFTRQFGKKVINFDHDTDVDVTGEFRIDEGLYDRYRADYIKVPGTPDKLFWDIVADGIG